ncbi:hypothetical protein ACSHWB_35010 [Lentzea sp. HUAS TT2]|uniref:hypothetical protein n=1 Tax=Lentzea sp. HUAS TT2 TaxID=3447454 RepID=UPI003F71BF52
MGLPDMGPADRSSGDRFAERDLSGRRIGVEDVAEVEMATDDVRTRDYRDGGGHVGIALNTLLDVGANLLLCGVQDELRPRLLSAVADVHNIAGWVEFDRGLTNSALVHLSRARELAGAAGNADLLSNVAYRAGRVHLHNGNLQSALDSFDRGCSVLSRSRQFHAQSILLANSAWAYACMGDVASAQDCIFSAREFFELADTSQVSAWSWFFDEVDLSAVTGLVWTELARTADPKYTAFAIPAIERACEGYPAEMRRSRVFALIASAINHLRDGEIGLALERGSVALDLSASVASTRVKDRFRPLLTELAAVPVPRRTEDVSDVISRLTATCEGRPAGRSSGRRGVSTDGRDV